MNIKKNLTKVISLSLLVMAIVPGCSVFPKAVEPTPLPTNTIAPLPMPTNPLPPPPTAEPSPTFTEIPPSPIPPTETVTPLPIMMETATPLPPQGSASSGTSRCNGLHGRLEVRVYIGEAASVGMEAFSIGEIPFGVTTSYAPYRIQGKGKLVQKGKTEEDWGFYKADINMTGSVSGQCLTGEHDGELRLNVSLAGNRTVTVRARGFNKTFTLSGGDNIPITMMWQEGYYWAANEWIFVIHKGPGED